MTHKMKFSSVLSLVIGSQLGSALFILPATLADYGWLALYGWLITSLGALSLAWIFGVLSGRFPEVGGPHHYVKLAFGNVAAFFTGWTYWVVSWVSTSAVVVAAVASLTPIIGPCSVHATLAMEISLLLLVVVLNWGGVQAVGGMDRLLTVLKVAPLLIIPAGAFLYFNGANLVATPAVAANPATAVKELFLLTFWGFIGLEAMSTSAHMVERPEKTLPRAITLGTLVVAVLCVVNTAAVMGLMPARQLAAEPAPYIAAAKIIFGGKWYIVFAMAMALVYLGALNAWVLASSQAALGLAKEGFMPKRLAQTNRYGAPTYSILLSSLGIIPLLCATKGLSVAKQVHLIIDFSVVAFLFVYGPCAIAYIVLLRAGKIPSSRLNWAAAIVATLFMGGMYISTPWKTLHIALLFVLSGLPLYLLWYRPKQNKPAKR
jgi:APA family basic amino acid/polyamine antiporter